MKIERNRILAILIALLMIASIPFGALQVASAHTPPWTINTYAYVNASPSPIGVNQTVAIVFWLNEIPPSAAGISGDRWRNEQITITKPDQTKVTLGPFTSDPPGSANTLYTPDQVGTYTVYFSFPGQVASLTGPTGIPGTNSAYVGDTYLPSNATTTFVVQNSALPAAITYPLPTKYWTRPIEGQNDYWYTIGSNWLGSGSGQIPQGGAIQPDGIGPNSAHVMWTYPYRPGGIVGGSNTMIPANAYYTGQSYEIMGSPLILNGIAYYNLPLSEAATGAGYVALNLQTGQQVFYQNTTMPAFGQIFCYGTLNQWGAIPYLWKTSGTTWMAYDPTNGLWLFNETNVPTGTVVYGPNGEILKYVLSYNQTTKTGWIAQWNNTEDQKGLEIATGTSASAYEWRPIGKVVDMSTAYDWNITFTGDITSYTGVGPSISYVFYNDVMIGISGPAYNGASPPQNGAQNPYTVWAIDLKPATRGHLLWCDQIDLGAGNSTTYIGSVDPISRTWTLIWKEKLYQTGYSLDTGAKVWGPTAPVAQFDYYGQSDFTAYGNQYTCGTAGLLYCYNMTTGALEWTYGNGNTPDNDTAAGLNAPWPYYPIYVGSIADGKVYCFNWEHSPNVPFYKGYCVSAIDAYTGKLIWNITCWTSATGSFSSPGFGIADGYLLLNNNYDSQFYCIGRGPSQTTVEAPMSAVQVGSNIVIQGTVMDIAAGTRQNEQAADFPNGVPCVSDASETAWMEYVYMQKPFPTDTTGVPVTISVIDSNNNQRIIGTTTSDASGTFALNWAPDIAGNYTIIANFAGTNSYWPSSAETHAYANTAIPTQAPTVTAQANIATTSDLMIYMVGGVIAIIIAIAIVGILMLRKRA